MFYPRSCWRAIFHAPGVITLLIVLTIGISSYSCGSLTVGRSNTLTPSKTNYFFNPASRSFNDLSGHQRDGFTIADGQPHVLEFNGSAQRVNYGKFWLPGEDLGHFFWEFWAMPGERAGSRYLVSDGYGGAHAILFGFAGPLRSIYVFSGNVFNGTTSTTFGSDEGPAPNEWGHYAVGWDGDAIVTYFNGVPVGKRVWKGPRRTPGPRGGGGTIFVGGSTHQNFIGRLAQVRAYEGRNPLEGSPAVSPQFSAFAPQTIFSCDDPFWKNCAIVSRFTSPSRSIVDLSGKNRMGLIQGAPPPQFVIDPTAPTANRSSSPAMPAKNVLTPPPVPNRARIFDSFSRQHSTYAFDGKGGLGSTESGTAGARVWQYSNPSGGRAPYGILNGRAVILSNNTHAAWVPTGISSANINVRVDRRPGRWDSGISTGLVFRWRDAQNFFFAYTTGTTATTQKLYVSFFANGTRRTLVSDAAMPERWTTLSVATFKDGRIEVYANTTLVYSTNSSVLANETGAGLWNWGPGQALANRWDNFTVLDATENPVPKGRTASSQILKSQAADHRR
jgi:hypothetical protein